MAKNKSSRKAEKAQGDIASKAASLIALGAAFYLISFVLKGSMLTPVVNGLRMVAPWPIVLGALLLLLQYVLRRNLRPRVDANVAPVAPQHADPYFPKAKVEPQVPTPARPREIPTAGRQRASTWGDKVFDDIEWRRFEALCEALFTQAGFEARTQSHGADGGVDIWLYSRNATGPAAVVQCKHWRKPVGVKEIREFFGVMASHGLKRGTFATSSTFTPDATDFARKNGISALDGAALLKLIGTRDAQQQQRLLDVAYEGEYWRPTCANCGLKMVERKPRSGGDPFWGCAGYPQCRGTLAMRRHGAST